MHGHARRGDAFPENSAPVHARRLRLVALAIRVPQQIPKHDLRAAQVEAVDDVEDAVPRAHKESSASRKASTFAAVP